MPPQSQARAGDRQVFTVRGGSRDPNIKRIWGDYAFCGQHHSRPAYRRINGSEYFLYYFDEREGPRFCGWWIGRRIGGNRVAAYNNKRSMTPPTDGWRAPWMFPVDETLAVVPVAGGSVTPRDGATGDVIDLEGYNSDCSFYSDSESISPAASDGGSSPKHSPSHSKPTQCVDAMRANKAGWRTQLGERVSAIYPNGRWYPARIAEVKQDGTYLVTWDDGDTRHRHKTAGQIRPRLPEAVHAAGAAGPRAPSTLGVASAPQPPAPAAPAPAPSSGAVPTKEGQQAVSAAAAAVSPAPLVAAGASRMEVDKPAGACGAVPTQDGRQAALGEAGGGGSSIDPPAPKRPRPGDGPAPLSHEAEAKEAPKKEKKEEKEKKDKKEKKEKKESRKEAKERSKKEQKEHKEKKESRKEARDAERDAKWIRFCAWHTRKERLDARASERRQVEGLAAQVRELKEREKKLEAEMTERLAKAEEEVQSLKKREATLQAEVKSLTVRTQGQGFKVANAIWEYEADGGEWHSFGVDASEQLYIAYVNFLHKTGPQVVYVVSGGHERQIDLKDRFQVTAHSTIRRGVRLRLNIPSSWQHPASTLVVQERGTVRVQETRADILLAIKELMCSTAHEASPAHPESNCHAMRNLRVQRVWRIENFGLWCRYRWKAWELMMSLAREQREHREVSPCIGLLQPHRQKRLGDATGNYALPTRLNERWLFHGTSWSSAEEICQSGFDHRVSSGGLFGDGTYFASQSCKSHQYTCEHCPTSSCRCSLTRTMLLARVLIADPYYTKEAYDDRRPPEREDGKGLYHAVVGSPGVCRGHPRGHLDHQEIVIYDTSQAYPAFWVEYTVS